MLDAFSHVFMAFMASLQYPKMGHFPTSPLAKHEEVVGIGINQEPPFLRRMNEHGTQTQNNDVFLAQVSSRTGA